MVRLDTTEERVVYYAICLTWVWYAVGALYILAPALGWSLMLLLAWRWLSEPSGSKLAPRPIPPLVWVWIVSMAIMQVALMVGHFNFDLSIPQLIKSSIGWMKGWALFAVFPLIGACLRIKPAVVYRASGWVALQTLLLVPLMGIAPHIGLPGTLYVSPLQVVGGPGPEFFEVQLYGTDPMGNTRWRFFTPWAPAAAVAFGMLFVLLLRDRSAPVLKAAGLLAVLAVAVMCKSRLGFLAIPLALIATWGISRANRPGMLFLGAAGFVLLGFIGQGLLELLIEQKERMDQLRPDSSYVRRVLAQIAIHRWWTEAPIFGHGIVESGPHLVEFMPIGSHHSWYGLLFVKGLVGFVALLVPLVVTLLELAVRAQTSRSARAGLAVMILFTFFTFTENVEILAYLMWPGIVVVGIASAERFTSPFRRPLAGPARSHPDPQPHGPPPAAPTSVAAV